MADPRPARPDDAFEIARLRSELILAEPGRILARRMPGPARHPTAPRRRRPGLRHRRHRQRTRQLRPRLSPAAAPAPKYPKGLAARIHAVAAEPSYRRRGYAKAALATLLEHLEQHSVTRYERPCTKGSVSGPTPRS
ncbi:GNAT family N-acetyltransferase [Streptomyces tricolor]|nr:GNAT family N-acetyltransferase [Streptomyces tricolor]